MTPPTPHPTRPLLVTGANVGVGFEAARALAADGHPVVLVCRSRERGEAAMGRIRSETPGAHLDLVVCDLQDFDAVRGAATQLAELAPHPLALINNAGVYRAALEHTPAGFERTMAVNHLGPYLLTRLLERTLRESGARVVQVASAAHRSGRLQRSPLSQILREPPAYRGFGAYADSKLANVLFTRELARRWPEVTALAVHPGMLSTAIWDRNRTIGMALVRLVKPFMGDPADGGRAVAEVATHPRFDAHDGAYVNRTTVEPARLPEGADLLARELWEVSAQAVGLEA